jgi:hypothetical protein
VSVIITVALDEDILPTVYYVRRAAGAVALVAAFPAAGSSSSLPIDKSER